jgi:hypothetical protein
MSLTEAMWDPTIKKCRAGCAGLKTENIEKNGIETQYCIGPPKDMEEGRWNAQKGVWELCNLSNNEFMDSLSGECLPCDALYLAYGSKKLTNEVSATGEPVYKTIGPVFDGTKCVPCPSDKPKWNEVSRRCTRYGYKKGKSEQECDYDDDCVNKCSKPFIYVKRNGATSTKRKCLGRGAIG